jgi:hypothetical protein
MEAEDFANSLRTFCRRQPFQPFQVFFEDGTSLILDHPEAMVVLRGTIAVYQSPQGEISFFDHNSISRFSNSVNAPTQSA